MANYRYNYDRNLNISFADKTYYRNFLDNRTSEQPSIVPTILPTEPANTSTGGSWLICLAIFLIIIFTIWRYSLLGRAIEKNNTLASLALLSPEIGNAIYLSFL
jgi:hypothetical protein